MSATYVHRDIDKVGTIEYFASVEMEIGDSMEFKTVAHDTFRSIKSARRFVEQGLVTAEDKRENEQQIIRGTVDCYHYEIDNELELFDGHLVEWVDRVRDESKCLIAEVDTEEFTGVDGSKGERMTVRWETLDGDPA